MLEAGLWLQEAGFRGVGVATREKEARWKILHRKLQQEHDKLERKWTLRSRCGKYRKKILIPKCIQGPVHLLSLIFYLK